MGALKQEELVSEAEFWEMVSRSDERLEFFQGRVWIKDADLKLMAGGGYTHSRLIQRLGRRLEEKLEGKPCTAVGSEFHVRITGESYLPIPDNAIHCEDVRFDGPNRLALLNPIALFEILSPGTEKFDRRGKFDLYTRIESLRDYVLLSTDYVRVEHFSRQEDGWLLKTLTALPQVLVLRSADIEVSLFELYDDLDVPVQLTLLGPDD